jgi:hypothetical protein
MLPRLEAATACGQAVIQEQGDVTDSTTKATATLKLQNKGVIAKDEEEKQEGGVLRRPIRNRKPNSMLSGPE